MSLLKVVVLLFLSVYICGAQKINVTTTPMIVVDTIQWSDYETALFLGRRNESELYASLWRTTDGGLTWQDQSSKLSSSSRPLAPLFLNEAFPSKIFIVGYGNVDYLTSDHGATWTQVKTGTLFVDFHWHPTNMNYAIALSYDYNLYLSTDGGATWNIIRKSITPYFSWGDAGSGQVPERRIYYVVETDGQSIPYNIMYSDDFLTTEAVLVAHGFQFIFMEKHIVAAVYLPTVNEVAIQVSPHIGKKYKAFYDTTFPFGDKVKYNSFALIDDHTGAVYLGVDNNEGRNSHWSNVYSSDSSGSDYMLSIEHIGQMMIDSNVAAYDFDRVRGVEGVYMANQLVNWQDNNSNRNDDEYISFYTLNNGANWQQLAAPHFDADGKPISCSGNCHLHLNGYTRLANNFGPFYSADSAAGLIIGTGSIGEYLSVDSNEINTYISRDAGLTWREIIKGSTIYEIGDHGGIIVFAPYGQQTNYVYYTTDFGMTLPLKQVQISTTTVTVENVIIEPSFTGERFIVVTSNSLITLDFSAVFDRLCGDSDYERWSPSDGRVSLHQGSCLMGRTVVYIRRNTTAQCFNDEDKDYAVSSTNCACTEDDYECDFGYGRDVNGECVVVNPNRVLKSPPDYCPEGDTYSKTKGYRLEPGNTCEGGVNHRPDGPYDCPTSVGQLASNKGWLAALIIIPIVLVLIVGGCFAIRSQYLQEKMPFLKALASWKIGYLNVQPDTLEDMDPEDREMEVDEDPEKFSVGLDDDDVNINKQNSHDLSEDTDAPIPKERSSVNAQNFFDPQ